MARNKRRIDNERDKSTKQRKLGYTKVAAASLTATAFFNRYGTKDFKSIKKTISNISSDLSGKKKTASNILDSIDKRIGKKGSVYKELRNSQRTINQKGTEKISIKKTKGSFDTRGLISIFKDSREKLNDLNMYKSDYLYRERDKLIKRSIAGVENQNDIKLIKDIVRNAYEKVEKVDGIFARYDKSNVATHIEKAEGFLDKKINMLSSKSKANLADIINDVYYTRTEAEKYISSDEFLHKAKKMSAAVSEELKSADNIKNYLGTTSTNTYSKLSKVVKNFSEVDVDLEHLITGSRKATVGEVLDEYRKFKSGKEVGFDFSSFKYIAEGENNKLKTFNFMEELESHIKNNEGFEEAIRDVSFGHNIRVKKGLNGENHFFSSSEIDDTLDKAFHWFSETLPGGLFKSMDIYQSSKTPYTAFFRAGTIDRLARLENKDSIRLENSYLYIAGKMKRIDSESGFITSIEDPKFNNVRLMSGEHGSFPRMIKDMLGTDNVIANASSDRLSRELDIHQSGTPNIFERVKANLNKHKNEDWDKNKLLEAQRVLATDDFDSLSVEQKIRNADNLKLVNKEFDEYTNLLSVSDDTLEKMLNSSYNKDGVSIDLTEESKRKIRLLLKGDIGEALYSQEQFDLAQVGDKSYESIINVLNSSSVERGSVVKFADVRNNELLNLMNKHAKSSDTTEGLLNIASKTNKVPLLGIDITRTNAMKPDEIFRREVIKDILLSESAFIDGQASSRNLDRMFNYISELDISDNQKRALTALNSWGIFSEEILKTTTTSGVEQESSMIFNAIKSLQERSPSTLNNVRNNISNVLSENFAAGSKPFFGNLSEQYANDYNKYMSLKRSSLIDLLADMNANAFEGTAKELVAGRHDIENISVLSTIPYGMVARLNYAIEDLGIGLSMDSSKSALDLIKNIGLKRILPIAAVMGAYDYLDYEADNLTGKSLTSAAAQGLAGIDLAARKLADSTGMGFLIDSFKESSVIGEYLTGSNEYQSFDERVDWYNNGYSPVRSSRFWSFGSSSEYRGGGIAYWQPNYLKRAESNWREIGIYGSAEDKWKHSIIPTLRHPFSTIEYLLDPYWLEKKNIDTRPYPYTGKMFSEGTPWGAVLNPTIGEIIKPVKMLPEIRKRLGRDNVDLKAILRNMNERELAKGNEDNNVFVIDGTDIKNAEYTPYAYATPGEINVQISNGKSLGLRGVGWDKSLTDVSDINVDNLVSSSNGGSYYLSAQYNTGTSSGLSGLLKTMNEQLFSDFNFSKKSYMNVGSELNNEDGALIFNNPVGNMLKYTSDFYSSKLDPKMINSNNKANDYINDAKFSVSQLSGMYGFLNDFIFGDDSKEFRLEQAGNMYSFTRGFWDASIGGVGGPFMEIARRFFPHEDRSRINYNPLVNDMERWLPQRFLTGDAYAALPKGEMRLPGKGYESLNELHSDSFGTYGAFDRMKILGDVAPSSEEYKLWRKIAKSTVKDENLIKEMKEIEYRAKKASTDHDFYEYRYMKNPVKLSNDTIKNISEDGVIELGSGMKVTLAGIETTGDAISTVLSAGDKVTIKTVKDEKYNKEDESVKAIIHKRRDNISKTLVDQGLATKDRMDDSVLAPLATTSSTQEVLGAVQEAIGHAKIPIVHNKFLKIESAIESYKNEKIYGASFQTWDNPIESFIKPQMNEQLRKNPIEELFSVYGYKLFKKSIENGTYKDKIVGSGALMLTNPAATLGASIGFATKMRFGKESMLGAEIGNAIGLASWAYTNASNPLTAIGSFAIGAYEMSRRLELDELIKEGLAGKIAKETIKSDVAEKAIKFLGKFAEDYDHRTGAVIGAGVGLAVSILKNPELELDRFFEPFIPKKTKKIWDIEEYFDRLEYIKYTGLYQEAARRAKVFEGSDIAKILSNLDKKKKEVIKLQRKANKIGNKYVPGSSMYEAEMEEINSQLEELNIKEQAISGGKYTKAAIAYKKMAESTVYGLNEASTKDEIMRAANESNKDFVQAFMNEKSKKKRKEILKYASPQMKKILQVAWGEKVDKQQSNASYFTYHKLPGMNWRGWKPNVNLKHVEMKTIQNEGMILSDFGFYDSEKAKASYTIAPDVKGFDNNSLGIANRGKLMLALGGHGLAIDNVSVETTSAPGLWILGDVQQRASEYKTVASRGIDSALRSLFL